MASSELDERPKRVTAPPTATPWAAASRSGFRVMMRMMPPIEPTPYSDPCGPRISSTRSTSTSRRSGSGAL